MKFEIAHKLNSWVDARAHHYVNSTCVCIVQEHHISLTIAVTSAESERSFSTLKRIKTRLRSRMVEDRLSALINKEREIAEKVDRNEVVDKFASTGELFCTEIISTHPFIIINN